MGIDKVTNVGVFHKNSSPMKPISSAEIARQDISQSQFDKMRKLSSASTASQVKAALNLSKSQNDVLRLQLLEFGAKTIEFSEDQTQNLEKKYRIDSLRDYLEKRIPQEHYIDPYFTCITSVPEQVYKEQGIDEYSRQFAKNLTETFDKDGLVLAKDIIGELSWLFDSQIELLTKEINSQVENVDSSDEAAFYLDDFKIVETATNPFDSENESLGDVTMNKEFMRTYNDKLKQMYSFE